jgi:hypothetical protein|tara:strand:+ start:214 stop:429 length:216 start_codon:yes stop_codon:yes gene_type:complete
MDSIMKQVGSVVTGLTGLLISFIGLAVAGQVVFGQIMNLDVIGNITGIVDQLTSGGFVGLVVLLILWGQMK